MSSDQNPTPEIPQRDDVQWARVVAEMTGEHPNDVYRHIADQRNG